jgi:hypothetical protein
MRMGTISTPTLQTWLMATQRVLQPGSRCAMRVSASPDCRRNAEQLSRQREQAFWKIGLQSHRSHAALTRATVSWRCGAWIYLVRGNSGTDTVQHHSAHVSAQPVANTDWPRSVALMA